MSTSLSCNDGPWQLNCSLWIFVGCWKVSSALSGNSNAVHSRDFFFFSLPFASPLYRVAYIPGDQNNARRHFSSDTPHSTLAYYHQVKESFEIESQNEAAFPSSFKQKPCNSCVSAVLVHAFHYFPDHRSISYDFPLFFPKNCKWFGVWPWYKHKQGPYNSRPSINR